MVTDVQLAKGYGQAKELAAYRAARFEKAHARVTTRGRGVIPGCRAPDPDSHMAVDSAGRPWLYVSRTPSTIDTWLFALREDTRQQRRQRNACEICGEMECEHGKKRRKTQS